VLFRSPQNPKTPFLFGYVDIGFFIINIIINMKHQ